MNKITIIGNLTRNPDLRTVADNIPVCSFSVAVNGRGKDQGTEFFNVTAWRGLGENCAKFLEKGRKVAVVGSLHLRQWEKDSKHGASLEVQAEEVEFLSSRNDKPEKAEPVPVQTPEGLPW